MNFDNFHQIYHIPIPEWLLDQAFCEVDKQFIETEEVNQWALDTILPVVRQVTGITDITICANHVNIGTNGVSPHDHLPHAFTSVLFLVEAEGKLVIHTPDEPYKIKPQEGMLVFFPADIVHHVEPSYCDELRISFVSNYERTSV